MPASTFVASDPPAITPSKPGNGGGFPPAASNAPMPGENLAEPGVPFGIICEDMGGDIWPYDIAGIIEGEATYWTPGDCLDEFMGACMS
jgi:hypothetical protein